MDERVNVTIIGAGPAGAAAGIYLKRADLDPIILEPEEPGGLLREANLVENYPGFPDGVSGKELASLIARQLQRLEVRVIEASAKEVHAFGSTFKTTTENGSFTSDAVVIATGTEPKKADITGADTIEGERLFYGVSALTAERVSGKRIAVLGGGDAAFDYAMNLSGMGGAVTVLSRSEPTCLPLLADRARGKGIDVLVGCNIKSLSKTSAGVVVVCDGESCPDEIVCEIVVVAYGREPRLGVLDRDLRDRISGDHPPETGVHGLYLVGDVARGKNRQATIAAGDGVLAAMIIERSARDMNGGRRH